MLPSYIQSRLNPEEPLWRIAKNADLYEIRLRGHRITVCSTFEKTWEAYKYYNSYLFGNSTKEVQAYDNL
jgi:hypothetical protein